MRRLKRLLSFIILLLLTGAGVFIYNGYSLSKEVMSDYPLDKAISEIKQIEKYTTIDELPKLYKTAVVAVEDRRFYYHNGFDIIGITRSIITNIKERELSEGGSTITQQLAKNIYFIGNDTIERKLAEIFIALKIEDEYSKDEILELYFNVIYYGSGYYNIYDASMGYFNKHPSEMSDYESTLLAGVPNAPSVYSPKNQNGLAEKRQEKVLDTLVNSGHISPEYKDEILLFKNR